MPKNCFIRRFLALFFVLLLVVASLPVVPAHAVVLDPVAWLYPIWVVFGQQAGVTVSTMGGNDFSQTAFPSLFDEWQSYESSTNGVVAQTLSSFVQTFTGFVDIGIALSQGSLSSVLKVGKDLVAQLARFWNWIIVHKLGGSSVDSTDFNSSAGNVAVTEFPFASVDPYVYVGTSNKHDWSEAATRIGIKMSDGTNSTTVRIASCDAGLVYAFHVGNTVYFVSESNGLSVWYSTIYLSTGYVDSPTKKSLSAVSSGLYYYSVVFTGYGFYVPEFESFAAAIEAFQNASAGDDGSITVAPSPGIDVLGFPDTSQPDYAPSDAVIPWNIPWDETKDTDDYLEEAYDKALENDLTVVEVEEAPPISGDDTVGPAGDYLVPGLSTVFPFCIPFDIYNFLSALAAEPAAPSFSCTLAFPAALGGPQTVVIDFDTPVFNQLAQLLRLLELLAFIVGLAFVTRSMFLRG